ncbi:ankyrin repeat protein [Ophiostoma piceae UAMH 11346]|uniref:Ankyrin repeat protein n=1 Tax=Ophiostoma piceae (strain UAMH 11346) TaxID=1262450 RepID=S3BZ99_OPHP1|nr:ankyrin repeat protein [Ophiostoma piceae UAMH 11346]
MKAAVAAWSTRSVFLYINRSPASFVRVLGCSLSKCFILSNSYSSHLLISRPVHWSTCRQFYSTAHRSLAFQPAVLATARKMPFLEIPPIPAPLAKLPDYIAEHPDVPITELLEPYRKYEARLREVYAQEPNHPALLDPDINVVPLFNKTNPNPNIRIRARNLEAESEEEQSKYIMALPKENRRLDGTLAVVPTFQDFQNNFAVFSESALSDVGWDNIVAAGSSVVNCLLPIPDKYSNSRRSLREFFHEKFSPASDVDLFLYGLTEEEAVEKIKQIEIAVRDSILSETTTVRTKHAITICSEYPTRHIQIVLRIYKSVSEILTGFDIDSSCAAFDGKQVYCTPRALQSYMTQINHVDLTRRSPSYENRLSKYSHRNFEVYWPDLDRSRIDPTIFERSFRHTLGLARLLVLERLPTAETQQEYAQQRREERGRPHHYIAPTGLRGNIKDEHIDEVAEWISQEDVSNYDTFVIPYGRRFTAKRIEKLCYTRDLLLNAEWNQKKTREAYLHRHPAFFGRAEDVMNDCCGYCPKPVTEKEKEMAELESKIYISGKISFLTDNPGRQQIGSFNPLTDNDWTDMAYVGNTARFCQAIVDGDLDFVKNWLSQDGVDPDRRDHTGRTPLHLASICSTPEVVKELVDRGARLVARVADGRTALHFAAQRGSVEIVKILMNKSNANEAEEFEKEDLRRKTKQQAVKDNKIQLVIAPKKESVNGEDTDASGDEEDSDAELVDATSEYGAFSTTSGSFVHIIGNDKSKESPPSEGAALEDNGEEPDFYNVNVVAWDQPCSAVHYAVIEGHTEVVKVLCQEYGADILLPVKFINQSEYSPTAAILTLALCLHLPTDKAKTMVTALLSLGSTCSQADLLGVTAFHNFASSARVDLLGLLAEIDKTGTAAAINHISFPAMYNTTSPLMAAIYYGDINMVNKLLDSGAAPQIDFDTWLKSAKSSPTYSDQLGDFDKNTNLFLTRVEQPLITAIRSPHPEMALELLDRGADPDTKTKESHNSRNFSWVSRNNSPQNGLAIVRNYLTALRGSDIEITKNKKPFSDTNKSDEFLASLDKDSWVFMMASRDIAAKRADFNKKMDKYEEEVKKRAASNGPREKKTAIAGMIKTLEQIQDKILASTREQQIVRTEEIQETAFPVQEFSKDYEFVPDFRGVTDVTESRRAGYVQLFDAAWKGDLGKIKQLTLTAWGENKDKSPLSVAVKDNDWNSPFSLAFLRGHHKVAHAILEIAQAQYAPAEERAVHYEMRDTDLDSNANSEDQECSYCGSVHGDDDGPYRTLADNDQFTIENIGEVSMQVKGSIKPVDILGWKASAHIMNSEDPELFNPDVKYSMFEIVAKCNDMKSLKFLLDTAEHFSKHDLDNKHAGGSSGTRFYTMHNGEFNDLIAAGRTEMLAEVIKRTGAGLPLEHMIKKSGFEPKNKPQYYQGLTVYGKKRTDWAEAGRGTVKIATGFKDSPLVFAAMSGSLESVEWFLSDTPLRCYLEFTKSKAAEADERIAHLGRSPGGFEGAISRWLTNGRESALLAAIESASKTENAPIVEYLIKALPESVNAKSVMNHTPMALAALLGQVETLGVLVKNGGDQSQRHEPTYANLLHAILCYGPKAKELQEVLDLLDPAALARMFGERTHHASWCKGQTPLHSWLSKFAGKCNLHWHRSTAPYEDSKEIAEVLGLLLKYSHGSELNKIDSSGETPLHAVARLQPDPIIVRTLVESIPAELAASLLRRENAAGQTPIEVAHDRLLAAVIKEPVIQYMHSSVLSVSEWPSQDADEFVESTDDNGQIVAPITKRVHASVPQNVARAQIIWTTFSKYATQTPGKRQLVSLNEANDVARRVGRDTQARYGTKVIEPATAEGAKDKQGDEDDEDDDDLEGPANEYELMSSSFPAYKYGSKPWSYKIEGLDV